MTLTKYSPVDLMHAEEDILVRRALVALEKGETDRTILRYFNFFMKLTPVERVSFLHVLPKPDFWEGIETEEKEIPQDNAAQLQALKDLKMRTMSMLEIAKDVKTDFGIRQGSPLEELLAEADALDADLIVTGVSTRRGAHGILAKTLARHSTCNTLIVPDLSQPVLKSILVPIDFSENSAKALHMAVSLNSHLTLPAKITCIHVYDFPDASWYRIQRTESEMREMIEKNRQNALDDFLLKEIPDYHDGIDTVLVARMKPNIGNYVMETADELGSDLIVIGAKGHSKVERLFMGSVTEKVLALTTHIPVMIVK